MELKFKWSRESLISEPLTLSLFSEVTTQSQFIRGGHQTSFFQYTPLFKTSVSLPFFSNPSYYVKLYISEIGVLLKWFWKLMIIMFNHFLSGCQKFEIFKFIKLTTELQFFIYIRHVGSSPEHASNIPYFT